MWPRKRRRRTSIRSTRCGEIRRHRQGLAPPRPVHRDMPTQVGVAAARLRWGWVGAAEFGEIASGVQIIHPQKRFFAGGANSVRGFSQNRLGPSVLTIGASQLLGPAAIVEGDTLLLGPCAPAQIGDFTCDAESRDLNSAGYAQKSVGSGPSRWSRCVSWSARCWRS